MIRYKGGMGGWGGFSLKCLRKILTKTGMGRTKSRPKDEVWLKSGFREAYLKFGQGTFVTSQ